MKINSVNYMTNNTSFGRSAYAYPEYTKGSAAFGHSAVPYPEYAGSYYNDENDSAVSKIIDKIYSLFTPEVTQKSEEIKQSINKAVDGGYNQNLVLKHRLYTAA